MLDSFITWLDSYISREQPSGIVRAMVGLMAFAGLLGTVSGQQAVRVGAFVVVMLFFVSAVLLLLADRRRVSRTHDTYRRLLTRYCDFLTDDDPEPLVRVEDWKQQVKVQPNGDVTEKLTLRAVALREKVYFIRLTAGCRWDQSEKHRRKVKVIANSVTVNGVSGPRWDVTTSWKSAQKLTSVLHLHQPIKRGESVMFEVTRTWPAKNQPLMRDGQAEVFTLCTTRLLEIQHAQYSVVLPPGIDAVYELIGAGEPDVQLSADAEKDHDHRRVLTWRADKVPCLTEVGIRLQLK
jgi:hypothetical protein